ncbi:MAG: glycerate kinase [Muribaculaceae bacterium]|nr:glycerate kinase [Muribaculaceae bacterium]
MKIVIACDSFKGSLGSGEIGEAAKRGVHSVFPEAEVKIVAIADGGEGTVNAIVKQRGGEFRYCEVEGPLGDKVIAKYGIRDHLAVIEMAEASGLTLIPSSLREPLKTSSYGTGQIIMDAIRQGCREFMIGIGGSATNDGGIGMLQALGFRFIDEKGEEIGRGGKELAGIARIDDSGVAEEIRESRFTVACDVDNPLLGERGASRVFGPQKGADEKSVEILEEGLCHFSEIVRKYAGKDYSEESGAGAAGGMGFAFRAFLEASLKSGVELMLDGIKFDSLVEGVDLVITGEGCLDRQTLSGKAPLGVLNRAQKAGVPVVAIGGMIRDEDLNDLEKSGFTAIFPIVNGPVSLSEAMNPGNAKRNVERTVKEIVKLWYR